MKKISILVLFTVVWISCDTVSKPDPAKELESMKQADIEFSALSKEKGMRTAFMQFLDSNGILLRANQYPIIGKKAFEFLEQIHDSSFTLTWVPEGGEVSQSGDLGFTYGIYTFATADTSTQGTYVSIWKKQSDGSWKYVLDSGNEGLGKK